MWKDCQALQDEITALRRELHQIPEVGHSCPRPPPVSPPIWTAWVSPFVRSPGTAA